MNIIKFTYIFCLMLLFNTAMAQTPEQQITVSGKVTDKNNAPIAGVSILVQEKSKGITTGADGAFSFAANSNDQIIFKKEGYLTVSKSATELGNKTLQLTKALIDAGDNDDVYIPFGVRKKREITATVAAVNGDQLPQIPSSTLNNVFSGRLAGLYIQQTGSRPGTDDATFLVRGRSSYNNGQAPLILVDGVERDFVDMDLNEIESVSVLKDAASLSWYGMSGSNGVIFVRTKRGSASATKVTFDAQGGVQLPVDLIKPLDSYTYATLFNLAQSNNGISPQYNAEALEAYRTNSDPYKYPNNNFADQFLKKSAPIQRYVATVSGGNAFAKYFTMLSFFDQSGLYTGGTNPNSNPNTTFKRFNFRTNLDLHVNKSLDVQFDVAGRSASLNYPRDGNSGFLSAVFNTPPNAFPLLTENGSYGGSTNFPNNPLAMLNARGNVNDLTRTLLTTVNVKHKLDFITKGLSANAFYTYDLTSMYTSGFTGTYEYFALESGEYKAYGTDSPLNYANPDFNGNVRRNEFWGGLDYDTEFGKHGIKFSTRYMQGVVAAPGSLQERREQLSNRLSYSYNNKYFADVIGTYAGSETFMPGKRWGFFPAISAGWIVSEESFLKEAKFLNYLKLRGSYGVVGNDAISTSRRYAFNSYFNRGGSGYLFGTGYAAAANTQESDLANNNLTWERAKKADIGIDAKFFNQMISVTADYFHENRTDLLTNALLPGIIGQTAIQANGGEAEYKGFEASLNFNKKVGEVNLNVHGNYTHVKSNIISLPQEGGLPDYQREEGFPISGVVQGEAFNRRFLISQGLFRNQAEIDAAPLQRFSGTVRPGDIRYKDINGDGLIDNFDFVQKNYSNVPTAYFGFGGGAAYKGFDFSFLFQGSTGRAIQISSLINSGTNNTGYINQFSVDAWTPETAETALYPRMAISDRGNNTQVSDYWIRSADFIRLKHVELGYTLNKGFSDQLKIQSCRFYVTGFNLLDFNQLDGLPIDPEIPEAGYGNSYPYLRSFSVGLSVKF